ncbi:triple tyrosine motif-containing protein [Chryseolinea lacunae]|uniref:Two component regulator three Y domain-containing protein n=1 Tax=Chryseolinea lacunae TaxID=2801331 RepID=A0ABS1KQK5_9BACT|nr:triple tyrosine motif-containing protein [Chryseolinea lacunae]MBL0741750.1 hypothetical protein [Chryseolinea lacunae]
MRQLFLAVFLVGVFNLYGQTGNYFLSHFSPSEKRYDNVCFAMVQNEQGLLYFATRSGVLEFDGRNWNLIPGKGAIYSLQINEHGEMFWAGAEGYGKLEANGNGFLQLKTWSKPDVKDVFQCLVVKDKVYFLADDALFMHKEADKPVRLQAGETTGAFTGLSEIFGMIYVNTEQGVRKVEKNQLVPASLNQADDDIIFTSAYQNMYMVGLANNKIYLCGENLRLREMVLEDQPYVSANVMVSGTWVNRDLFVLGTLRGGLVFVHAATGKTQEIINYNTGLPDNEVFALMNDKSQSIWLAHEYGFTRVSPYLPFRSFSHYAGLEGNLLCARAFQDKVYVGTSLGLYVLEKEELYEEIVHYDYAEVKTAKPAKKTEPLLPSTAKTQSKPEDAKPAPAEAQSKRRGILWFLKRKRAESTPAETTTPPSDEFDKKPEPTKDGSNPTLKPAYQRIKKVERVLRSAYYAYKKVSGIDAKITRLVETDGQLIAAGLGGAYAIRGLQAQALVEEPVRSVFHAAGEKILFISTYKDQLLTLALTDQGTWEENYMLDELDEPISFVFKGKEHEFWLCGVDKIYRLEIADQTVLSLESIAVSNPNFDALAGLYHGNSAVVINAQGFFRYDRAQKAFVHIDTLAKPIQYFASESDIWFRDTHRWNLFGQHPGQSNLRLLNLFNDLRFISADPNSENLWVITGNNELYKFFGEKFTPYEAGYPLLLKTIRNEAQQVRSGSPQFDQQKSSITFEIVQPDYLASKAIEYRYKLSGLDKEWSEWSDSYNIVNFPYLPSGEYGLQAQAKDIFGNVKDLPPVSFEVLPPYWKRPWFYALEFALFASLVLLSFRLSSRYMFISRILSLLTIILLIQFIQTAISETFETRTSPVKDFLVQVLVAFLILPVEGYLRKHMLRSLARNTALHRFVKPKTIKVEEKPEKN